MTILGPKIREASDARRSECRSALWSAVDSDTVFATLGTRQDRLWPLRAEAVLAGWFPEEVEEALLALFLESVAGGSNA